MSGGVDLAARTDTSGGFDLAAKADTVDWENFAVKFRGRDQPKISHLNRYSEQIDYVRLDGSTRAPESIRLTNRVSVQVAKNKLRGDSE